MVSKDYTLPRLKLIVPRSTFLAAVEEIHFTGMNVTSSKMKTNTSFLAIPSSICMIFQHHCVAFVSGDICAQYEFRQQRYKDEPVGWTCYRFVNYEPDLRPMFVEDFLLLGRCGKIVKTVNFVGVFHNSLNLSEVTLRQRLFKVNQNES